MNFHRVLICAVAVLAGSPVLAQDYEIRLTRPAKVGQKYEVIASAEMSEQRTLSSSGRVLQENKFAMSATFEGTATVLKIDGSQQTAELRLLVSKCRKKIKGNATEEEVLPKGTQVVVRQRDSKTEFLIDGKLVGKDIAKVLDLFFSITITHSKITNDDVFGTNERKKVGDSWATDNKKAAKILTELGLKVDAKNIKGTTKLEKVVVVHGTKCLKISYKVGFRMFEAPLPGTLAVEKSNGSLSASGEFPIDSSIGKLSEKTTMTMAFVAKGKLSPDAPEITISTKMTQSKQMKRKFLK